MIRNEEKQGCNYLVAKKPSLYIVKRINMKISC